jgi:hypothetical protein
VIESEDEVSEIVKNSSFLMECVSIWILLEYNDGLFRLSCRQCGQVS